jgi:hypothetical protein
MSDAVEPDWHDRVFGEFLELDRARIEAYEIYAESTGDRLVQLGVLASRWRGLSEFWKRVRDDPATPFLQRVSADKAAVHAGERAAWCTRTAIEQEPAD